MRARESRTRKSRRRIDRYTKHRRSFLSNASRRDARERTLHDTHIFFDRDNLVALDAGQPGHAAAGPEDFDCVNVRVQPQSKVQPRILRGLVARATLTLVVKDESSS